MKNSISSIQDIAFFVIELKGEHCLDERKSQSRGNRQQYDSSDQGFWREISPKCHRRTNALFMGSPHPSQEPDLQHANVVRISCRKGKVDLALNIFK
jgi:hypothetical protein